MNNPQIKRWRRLRRSLVGLGVCLTLIGLFYTEELWRGKRAWENCKSALEARGVDFNWADYIPAPVLDKENFFGVPEMQKWFTGHGSTELSKEMSYSGSTARLTIAELTIGLPGISTSNHSSSTVFRWGDPQAKEDAGRLIKDALGPVVMSPAGHNFMLRQTEKIRPAQIFLQCQTAPTKLELLQFLPMPIANTDHPRDEEIQVEPGDNDSYKVTMVAPYTAAEFLKWSKQLEPEFALIRNALQRPYARMDGNYNEPAEIPIPNFVTIRAFAQTLGARAQCHLLEGQPEEALRDLKLLNDSCHPIMEENKPMTLVSAMINVAVRGLYAGIIADGLRLQAWREPELAALEEQLKQINLLPPVKQAFEMDGAFVCHNLETATGGRVVEWIRSGLGRKINSQEAWENSVLGRMLPRGWVFQNMVACVNIYPNLNASLEPASQIVFLDKVDAYLQQAHAFDSHWSPYTFMATRVVPNFSRATQTTAHNQTLVNQALIACALERYHLAHGEYPETLDALAPKFIDKIPHDVIGGQPLHYRRAADGTFILYSVGWNGRDDGGVRGKSITDADWVWPD